MTAAEDADRYAATLTTKDLSEAGRKAALADLRNEVGPVRWGRMRDVFFLPKR